MSRTRIIKYWQFAEVEILRVGRRTEMDAALTFHVNSTMSPKLYHNIYSWIYIIYLSQLSYTYTYHEKKNIKALDIIRICKA